MNKRVFTFLLYESASHFENKNYSPIAPSEKCRGDTKWLKLYENTFCWRKKYLPPPWRCGKKTTNSVTFFELLK
jgi:hypothetical protein